jgi:MOSC domain-containing protein YiiM
MIRISAWQLMTVMITSDSIGNPGLFLTFDDLCRGFEAVAAPRDRGRVTLIVRRRERGRREAPDRLRLTADAGVPGDAWIHRGQPDPAGQIAVMQADVAELIANGQPLELFGDNLFLHLDLSSEHIPPGSRVRVGGATLEVTPKAHNGCRKFNARFGSDALRFVSDPQLRHRNLRGIYMRVLEPGEVAVGDPVEVIARTAIGM